VLRSYSIRRFVILFIAIKSQPANSKAVECANCIQRGANAIVG